MEKEKGIHNKIRQITNKQTIKYRKSIFARWTTWTLRENNSLVKNSKHERVFKLSFKHKH